MSYHHAPLAAVCRDYCSLAYLRVLPDPLMNLGLLLPPVWCLPAVRGIPSRLRPPGQYSSYSGCPNYQAPVLCGLLYDQLKK